MLLFWQLLITADVRIDKRIFDLKYNLVRCLENELAGLVTNLSECKFTVLPNIRTPKGADYLEINLPEEMKFKRE